MPNRILKESICKSDSIDELSWLEEVFFYRLIVNCDDYGRYDARPKILKASLFPLKDITEKQIECILNKLSMAGMVQVYTYDQKPYLQLVSWGKHQTIRNKKSKYPHPPSIEGGQEDLNTFENNCMQLQADVPVIQSNPNPIRESKSKSNACADDDMNIFQFYERCGFEINGYTCDDLMDLCETYSELWVREAIRRAVENGAKTPAYFKAILSSWKKAGAMQDRKPKKAKKTAEGRPVDDDIEIDY